MPSQGNHLICFFALILFVTALTTACSGGTRLRFTPFATAETPGDAAQADQAAPPGEPATPDSTAQAALQAAVQALQTTPTEEPVVASGGVAPATPTTPLLTEGPSATITPAAGTANTWVAVTGSGFPARVRVDLYLAGVVGASATSAAPRSYATTITDQAGNYSLSFAMPGTWPAGSPIEPGELAVLVATEDFGVRATTLFEYRASATPTPLPLATTTLTPSPTLTPQPTATPVTPPTATPTPARNPYAEVTPLTGAGGSQLTLRGGGFPANTTVNVYLGTFDMQVGGGEPVRYGAATTDNSGNFTVSFTMPSTWPDGTPVTPGRLLILVATPDFGRQASAVFSYLTPTPTPSLNPYAEAQPQSGSANTAVTVRGGGFPPNTRVQLYLAGLISASAAAEAPRSYATTTTDSAGQYQLTFTMPATWPDGQPIESGTLALLVATDDFAVRANATFDYVAPTPTAVSPQSWRGSYYDNPDLRDEPVLVRQDAEIHFYWEMGSPDPLLPNDGFSVTWERTSRFEDGLYRFTLEIDDGARLFLDDRLILESWRRGERRTLSLDYPVQAGEHTIRLDYFEHTGNAVAIFRWQRLADWAPAPTATPGPPATGVLFSDHPWNNQRRVNQTFCSGFESECNYAGCVRNYRLLWGPYCREGDYPYIQPGLYRVTFYGTGPVRAGATDFGVSQQLFSFGQYEFDLPGSFTFCWPGRQSNGYGFETIAQSTGVYAAIDWVVIEYLGSQCR
jgi:hypothetical protein